MAFSAAAAALAELRLTVSLGLPFCSLEKGGGVISFCFVLTPVPVSIHLRSLLPYLLTRDIPPIFFPLLLSEYPPIAKRQMIVTYRPLSELDLGSLATTLSNDSLVLLEGATERTRGDREVAVVAVIFVNRVSTHCLVILSFPRPVPSVMSPLLPCS